MFSHPFSLAGRIRRTEFGLTIIISSFAYFMILIFSVLSPGTAILYFPLLWFNISQGAKRCHDMGNSGWYQLIPFYVFIMLFQEGDVSTNQYGPNPKNSLQLNFIPPPEQKAIHQKPMNETIIVHPDQVMELFEQSNPRGVVIPGKFTVLKGGDIGKSYDLIGHPAAHGYTMTIGREAPQNEYSYAHINLDNHTVSRKQAEIIHSKGKIYIKNLSATNNTIVDGTALPVEITKEITFGTQIRFGNVTVKYEPL